MYGMSPATIPSNDGLTSTRGEYRGIITTGPMKYVQFPHCISASRCNTSNVPTVAFAPDAHSCGMNPSIIIFCLERFRQKSGPN